ncbi:MAG TPA: hypothetical protein VEH01_02580 [Nitrososphaerales archaeon]|nr:hypothetical protein [Nitrososphaerales archaeon]
MRRSVLWFFVCWAIGGASLTVASSFARVGIWDYAFIFGVVGFMLIVRGYLFIRVRDQRNNPKV